MTTAMAKLIRDNSPPDAICAKAFGCLPGMVEIKNSNDSAPAVLGD